MYAAVSPLFNCAGVSLPRAESYLIRLPPRHACLLFFLARGKLLRLNLVFAIPYICLEVFVGFVANHGALDAKNVYT